MPSHLNEALEWLDRDEQAREVAQPTPTRGGRSWSLLTALTGLREPLRPQPWPADANGEAEPTLERSVTLRPVAPRRVTNAAVIAPVARKARERRLLSKSTWGGTSWRPIQVPPRLTTGRT